MQVHINTAIAEDLDGFGSCKVHHFSDPDALTEYFTHDVRTGEVIATSLDGDEIRFHLVDARPSTSFEDTVLRFVEPEFRLWKKENGE